MSSEVKITSGKPGAVTRLRYRLGDALSYLSGRVRSLAVRFGALRSALVLAIVPLTLVMAFSKMGDYIDEHLFFRPFFSAQASLGLQPKIPDDVLLVVIDDRALSKLGRFPSFHDWHHVAKILFEQGVETAVLVGIFDLKGDVGLAHERHASGRFVMAAAGYAANSNLRAMPESDIPTRFLVEGTRQDIPSSVERMKYMLGPDEAIFPFVDTLGSLKVDTSLSMSLGSVVGENRILPNIALQAVGKVEWRDGSLTTPLGPVPWGADNEMYIDFVDVHDAWRHRTLPITAFYDKDSTSIAEKPSAKLKDRLKGIRIALLIPEAYSGARFVDAPIGRVPAFFSTASLVSSNLRNHFLHWPAARWLLLLVAMPIVTAFFAVGNTKVALYGGGGLIICQWILCCVLLVFKGWVLPGAEFGIILTAGLGIRSVHHFLCTMSDRVRLGKDLEIGRTIQSLFLPAELKGEFGEFEYKIIFRPYGPMSGDWVQIHESAENTEAPFLVLAIGDVVGKGPSAALNTAAIACVWDDCIEKWGKTGVNGRDLVDGLHNKINRIFKGRQYTTLAVAFILGNEITFLCYASPLWLWLKTDNALERIGTPPSNPVGAFTGSISYSEVKATIGQGEVAFAYSDGVIDGANSRFQLRKALASVSMSAAGPAVFDEMEKVITDAGANTVLPDDFTLLMIRRRTEAEMTRKWQRESERKAAS